MEASNLAYQVTLIRGDGTRPELVEATRRVLEGTGVAFEWDVVEAGVDIMETAGTPLPDNVLASIRKNKVALKGPITTPIPLLSKDKLAIFKMIVGMIYSQHGGQRGVVTGHHVSGQLIYQTTYALLTAEQEQAMAYLKEWSRRIGAAIKADKPTQ